MPVRKRIFGRLRGDFDIFALLLHQRGFLDMVGMNAEANLHQCQCFRIEVNFSPIEVLLRMFGRAEMDNIGASVFYPSDVGEEIDTFVAR